MKLYAKTLVISLLVLLTSVIVLNILSRTILLNSYRKLEQNSVEDNLHRAIEEIDDEVHGLGQINAGWARSSQMASFVEDRNPTFVDQNLAIDTFLDLHVDVLLIFDDKGNRILGRAFDLDQGTEMPVPSGLKRYFTADSPFLHPSTDLNHPTEGTLLLDGGPIMVAAHPIINRFYPEAHGTLIMGRFLDARFIGEMADRLTIDLTAYSVANPLIPDDVLKAIRVLTASPSPYLVQPLDDTRLAGYAFLHNPDGSPTVVWRVVIPRDIYAQGLQTVTYFLGVALAVGLLFTAIILLFLDRFILARLKSLHQTVNAIRLSRDLTQRVTLPGNDELSELGGAINDLVRELDTTQTSLNRALQVKSDMLANVSHDARSPLSTIQLRAEMLKLGVRGPMNAQQQESVDDILDGAQQLLFFVNNLLDASRLEAGGTTLNCRDFSLNKLVDEMTTSMRPQAESKGLDFQVTVDEDLPASLYGDPERLTQVLSNLIGNAIRFTDQGRVGVAFHCAAQERLRIEVADTGQGIPPEEQPHVFDAFYQVEPSMTRRHMHGVGLGLTIVKELVDLMGGTTDIQSEPGVGSTFIIEIPIVQNRKG